jgi:DNA-binding HxlR family transcriptional regulator
VAIKSSMNHRSGCPVSSALDLLGDRWSLLIVRDLMVRSYRTFREFQHSGEGIATNVLADRLHKLEAGGILMREPSPNDRRSTNYRLTEKGIALAPVLLELLIWGARYEENDASCAAIDQMAGNRAAVLAEAYRRWKLRDTTPLIPSFSRTTKSQLRSNPNSPKGKSNR